MPMRAISYYQLLGVSPRASAQEIEAAFKRRARKYHPKLNPDDPAAEHIYRQLCAAFRTLKDPALRRQYDQRLTARASGEAPPRPFRPPSSRSPVQQEPAPTRPARPARAPQRPLPPGPALLRRRSAFLRVRRTLEAAKRVLWWGLSAAVHALLIWLMAHWNYASLAMEREVPPLAVGIRPEVEPEQIETGREITPPEPEEIPLEEVEPDPVSPDSVALSEAEREAATAVLAVEGGGAFALRTAEGRARAVQTGGATEGSENAVNAGLRWLKENQLRTGAWRTGHEGTRWADPAVTGLAALAFLGAGYTHQSGPYRRTVGSALAYIKSQQESTSKHGRMGCIAHLEDGKPLGRYMYVHAICTLTLCEAYAMTEDPLLRESAQRAIDFIVEVQGQNPESAWRYYATSSDADTSVAGWVVMGLRSARLAGLEVPEAAFEGARKYFQEVTDKELGTAAYMPTERKTTPALIAVGLLCNQYLGLDRNDPYIARAGFLINKHPPEWEDTADPVTMQNLYATQPASNNYYYWYYANLALHQRRDEAWEKWHPRLRDLLVRIQEKKGREAGSWPPNTVMARSAGRVYSTALAILALEVYYRYAPIYREVVDKVLAAYGHALNAYNEFAHLTSRSAPETAQARAQAVAKLVEFLQLSAPDSGEAVDKSTRKRRATATVLLIKLHRHAERYAEAIALLESLRERFPERVKEPEHTRTVADLHLARARQLAQAGYAEQAQEAEAKAMALYYDLVRARPRAHAERLFWLAERFYEREDWVRAVALYKLRVQLLRAAPSEPNTDALAQATRRIIACYAHLGRHQTAAHWLQKLEKLLGPTLTIRRERAALERRLGHYTQARRIYESLLPALKPWSPEHWEAWYDMLHMMLLEGRAQEVVRRIDALRARRPDLGGEALRERLLALRRQAAQKE